MTDFKLPPVLSEVAGRTQGLYFFSGERGSGLTNTFEYFRGALRDREGFDLTADGKLPPTAEFVTVQGVLTPQRLQQMIHLAEDGLLVLAFQSAGSVVTVLRRIFSQPFGEGRAHMIARLADQIKLIAAEKKVKALGGEEEDAREILLVSSDVRRLLAQENLVAVEDTLRSDQASLGSVSMNQSLLQLMIRRRIDVKTAFEASFDPSELDNMMKKAGF